MKVLIGLVFWFFVGLFIIGAVGWVAGFIRGYIRGWIRFLRS